MTFEALEAIERKDERFERPIFGRLLIAAATRVRRLDPLTFAIWWRSWEIARVHHDGSYTIQPFPRLEIVLRRIRTFTPAMIRYFDFERDMILWNDSKRGPQTLRFKGSLRVDTAGVPLTTRSVTPERSISF